MADGVTEPPAVIGFCRHCRRPITRTGWAGKPECKHLPHCPEEKKEEGLV